MGEHGHPLPVQLTRFVGRRAELARLHDLLDDSRAVTLTGAGGCGKTRLAIEVASARIDRHPGGVWMADLSPLNDESLVLSTVADAVASNGRSVDAAVRQLGSDPALLVMDNCEHVVDSCAALVEDLLRRALNLVVLATSREPLGVAGEVTFRVPGLTDDDAAELFVERARRARPDLGAVDDDTVTDICHRLDGIPLAIELAAARLRVLNLAQIRDGLQDRFRLLTGGTRTSVPRQQTLQASVDWSYALLLDAERNVLNRLSVFGGGFTLEAAAEVCADDTLQSHHVRELVGQLVDKSLVVPDDHGRFTLLETVRQYAAERLVAAGEADAVRHRQYEHCVGLARRGDEPGADEAYRVRIEADHENVRRALQFAADHPDPSLLARLAGDLYLFWATGRRGGEGSAWLPLAVERATDAADRARVVGPCAHLLVLNGRVSDAGALAREAIELARSAGDARAEAWALMRNGHIRADLELIAEGIAVADAAGAVEASAWGHWLLSFLNVSHDPRVARLHVERALELARAHGFVYIERLALAGIPFCALLEGASLAIAAELIERAIAAYGSTGGGNMLVQMVIGRSLLPAYAGDDARSRDGLAELAAITAESNDESSLFMLAVNTATVGVYLGDIDQARAACAETLRRKAPPGWTVALQAQAAVVELMAGDLDTAERLAPDVVARPTRTIVFTIPPPGFAGAWLARLRGWPDAEDRARGCIEACRERPVMPIIRAIVIRLLATVLADQGRDEEAIRLFAGADTEARRFGLATDRGMWSALDDGHLDRLRTDDRFDELWAAGATLDIDAVVEYAQRGHGQRRRPTVGWASLTPTERQVVDLVVAGATNKDVAERLFMSVATVKSHLTHTFTKLGVTTRAQLTAEAHRRASSPTSAARISDW